MENVIEKIKTNNAGEKALPVTDYMLFRRQSRYFDCGIN